MSGGLSKLTSKRISIGWQEFKLTLPILNNMRRRSLRGLRAVANGSPVKTSFGTRIALDLPVFSGSLQPIGKLAPRITRYMKTDWEHKSNVFFFLKPYLSYRMAAYVAAVLFVSTVAEAVTPKWLASGIHEFSFWVAIAPFATTFIDDERNSEAAETCRRLARLA